MGRNKKIILGVTSSVAIYRALDLIRIIKKNGHRVKVIMSANASKLVKPILFQALANEEVHHDTFDPERVGVSHISLARWGNIFVIAPATANVIGKLAAGIADDLLTTMALAFKGPKLIAPAMNDQMWSNSIVTYNCKKLGKHGYDFIGPVAGPLATGEVKMGHIAPVELIWLRIETHLNKRKMLSGHRFIVAGGRTETPIDPIRVITNRASGRMALTITKAIMARGGEVTLITGPTEIEIPDWIEAIKIRDSKQLKGAIEKKMKGCNCLIMATAVSDYQTRSARTKLKKDGLKLELRRAADIIKGIKKQNCFVVGFSLETEKHVAFGKKKLKEKGLDAIVVNTPGAIGSSHTQAWIIDHNGSEKLGKIAKDDLAEHILDRYLSWSKDF